MARFCLSDLQTQNGHTSARRGLGDRIDQMCVTFCVENAQKLIMLIQEYSRPTWWYRVFFLYIAMQHLITAMLRPDVFADVVQEYWRTAVLLLAAHEHLSLSVKRCLNSFQMMWRRVVDLHSYPTQAAMPSATGSDMELQGVFQHLGFDGQFPLYGLEDLSWLENADWVT